MAHQVNPLRTLVTDEFKEINTENFEDYFDKAQEEVARLKVENTELVASNEKLTKKLVKKKNELEIEKTNSNTFRQYIQELNAKVQQLERAAPPLNNPTIHPVQNPILNTVINEEFVERLVIEKSGLESQICEQKREIELLNSELISCKGELTNKTESQTNASALAQEVTKLETDILLKIQQLEESNSYSLKLEAECKLGKQLFQDALNSISAEKEEIQQQLDRERGLNEELHLDIEQLNNLNELQSSKLTEHLKEMDTSQSNEEKLQIHRLENENTQLKDDARILSAKIEEQNLQLIESKQSQQNNEKTQILIEAKEKQISDLKMQILDQQAKDQTYQTQVEKQTKELNEEFEQLKCDYTDLKDLLKSENKNEKFLVLETEKHSLNEQIDVLHGEIETLTESKKENEQNIKELNSSFEKLTNENKALEIQLEESKNEFNKLQEKGEEYYQNSQKQIDVLKTESETAMNELEQLKSDYTDLEKFFKSENEKFLVLETEKQTLEELTDMLLGQIEKLTQSKKENEQRIHELEIQVSKNPSQDLLQLNENIRDLEEKIRYLEEKEGELTELKGTFEIMSKESNNLTVEIEGMKNKQLVDEIQIHDLTDSIREYKRRDEELNNELTQLKHSNSVAMEGQVDSLKAEISKLENSNKLLSENFERMEFERSAEIKELTEMRAKQQQTIENTLFSDKIMSHYRQSGRPSLPPPAPPNRPPVTHLLAQLSGSFDQLWKCDFCGSIHPSERDKDIHMTHQCPASPMGVRDDTAVKQSVKRPPMAKADMATEIANTESKIQILDQNITIQNKGQLAQATPPPVMPSNPSKHKEDKKLVQKLSKDSKQKHTDTSGATPGATLSELTPQIIPVANKAGKSSTKIAFRPGMSVNTVKLKSLPNPADYQGKQVIYQMNKRYELGILMVLFEATTRLGLRAVTGKFVGIRLFNPVGNCSGEFRTKRYFECEQNYGIFVAYEYVLVPVV